MVRGKAVTDLAGVTWGSPASSYILTTSRFCPNLNFVTSRGLKCSLNVLDKMNKSSNIHIRIHNVSATFKSLMDALSISIQRLTHVVPERIEDGLDKIYRCASERLKIT